MKKFIIYIAIQRKTKRCKELSIEKKNLDVKIAIKIIHKTLV